jgi:hypothetical protein
MHYHRYLKFLKLKAWNWLQRESRLTDVGPVARGDIVSLTRIDKRGLRSEFGRAKTHDNPGNVPPQCFSFFCRVTHSVLTLHFLSNHFSTLNLNIYPYLLDRFFPLRFYLFLEYLWRLVRIILKGIGWTPTFIQSPLIAYPYQLGRSRVLNMGKNTLIFGRRWGLNWPNTLESNIL